MNAYEAITPEEAARMIDTAGVCDCRIAKSIYDHSRAALYAMHDMSGAELFSLAMVWRAGVVAGKRLERYRRKHGKKSVD